MRNLIWYLKFERASFEEVETSNRNLSRQIIHKYFAKIGLSIFPQVKAAEENDVDKMLLGGVAISLTQAWDSPK